ncbi:MAG: hypothetical protein A2048_01525 [Deltaproteobacteria bacterium GWA2_45_12]|nr:MAG: hypothetical protein A2048_01525 [Deltaproteobacteria bacterium GWA2_45_12]
MYHDSLNIPIPSALSINPPNDFSTLTKKVKPAVVNIYTTKEMQTRITPWANPFFNAPPVVQKEKKVNSLGSGFIINEAGDILTNNHVIEGADEIWVKLDDGRELKTKLIGRDPRLDIAVLRPDKTDHYPYVTLADSENLEVGNWVIAIGNPFGLGHTVTAGIVSAKARVIGAGPYDDFIQTDASINPGNSGGPLFNINGEVVGINTAIFASGQGLGFAIPINLAKEVIPQLISRGHVDRGWLGISFKELAPEDWKHLGLTENTGVYVAETVPGGPADKAGLKPGDVITEFNGIKIDNPHMLPTMVGKLPPESEVEIGFMHEGKKYARKVILGSLDNPQASITGDKSNTIEVLGMYVRDLNANEAQRVPGGVVVIDVKPGSLAHSAGIQPSDLVIEINSELIKNTQYLTKVLANVQKGQVVKLNLVRNGSVYYFAFRKE